jgi:hypothetical protein
MDERGSFHWRRGLLCGLLWGVAVTLIDPLTQPFGGMTWQEAVSFAANAGLASVGGGLVWSLSAEWTANHRRKLPMFALQLPVAVLATVATANAPIPGLFQYSKGIGRLMSNVPPMDLVCHLVWTDALFGGLYVLGYHATRRSIQLRRRLTELRMTCGEADMRLREMRLQAYRGQIRPATLLEALGELQLRYSIDRSAGDQLFDRLVDFLRAAMPGLRGGASTVSAELAIISSYAMLQNALRNDCQRWHLKISTPQTDTESNSIPLRVLASLDRIDRCVPHGQTIEITTESHQGVFGVKVKAHAACLSNEGRQRLKMDLESSLGEDAIVMSQTDGDLCLDLRLPAGAAH